MNLHLFLRLPQIFLIFPLFLGEVPGVWWGGGLAADGEASQASPLPSGAVWNLANNVVPRATLRGWSGKVSVGEGVSSLSETVAGAPPSGGGPRQRLSVQWPELDSCS